MPVACKVPNLKKLHRIPENERRTNKFVEKPVLLGFFGTVRALQKSKSKASYLPPCRSLLIHVAG